MKFVISISLALSLCVSSFAAEARGTFDNPKYPNKCYISEDLIMSPGEEARDPNHDCGVVRCQEKSSAVLETCSVIYFEGFEQGDYVDLSRPYPECCERELIKQN